MVEAQFLHHIAEAMTHKRHGDCPVTSGMPYADSHLFRTLFRHGGLLG